MSIKTDDENTFFAKCKTGELHGLTVVVSSHPVRFLLQAFNASNEAIRVRSQRNKRQKLYSSDKVFSLLQLNGVPLESVKLSSGLGQLDINEKLHAPQQREISR